MECWSLAVREISIASLSLRIGFLEAASLAQCSRKLRERRAHRRARGRLGRLADAQSILQEGDGALRLVLSLIGPPNSLQQACARLGLVVELAALNAARRLVEQLAGSDFAIQFAVAVRTGRQR